MGIGLGLGLAIGGGANVVAPAAANALHAVVDAITSCSSTTACSGGTNSSSGAGVAGTNSGSGIGVSATSKTGIAVQATTGNSNAISASNNSSSKATIKAEQSGSYSAIVAGAGSGVAIGGTATTGVGVAASATSTKGTAFVANANGGTGANVNSNGGIGLLATNNLSGWNPVANDPKTAVPAAFVASGATSSAGNAIGLVVAVQSPDLNKSFPLAADGLDDSNEELGFFDVDGYGNIYASGSTMGDVRTRGGAEAVVYAPKTTESTLEDTGAAQLRAGEATVALDPTYAQSIDISRPYRVFLTPDGDTRGLYVAKKTATSFVVRETQGGHASIAFDYRIVAAAAGHGADRIALLTPSLKAKIFPLSGGRPLHVASGATRAR